MMSKEFKELRQSELKIWLEELSNENSSLESTINSIKEETKRKRIRLSIAEDAALGLPDDTKSLIDKNYVEPSREDLKNAEEQEKQYVQSLTDKLKQLRIIKDTIEKELNKE